MAELARGKLRRKLPALRQALQGRFGAHHALLVGQILAKLDFLDEAIAQSSAEIDRVVAPTSRRLRCWTPSARSAGTARSRSLQPKTFSNRFPLFRAAVNSASQSARHETSSSTLRARTRQESAW